MVGVVVAASAAEDAPVATVGGAPITAVDVAARIASLPASQRRAHGDDAALRRDVLDSMIVDALLVRAGEEDGLGTRPDVDARVRSILVSSLLEELAEQIRRDGISDADVASYYEAHRADYASRHHVRIWQIVSATEADARAVLHTIATDAAFREDPVAGWEALARERSIDKTTAMTRGDLGFVAEDGSTLHQDVRVSPAIHAAAAALREGEVAAEPVPTGSHWAVIQRRGALVTPERSLASEADTIRRLLARDRLERARQALVSELRAKHLTEHHPDRIAVWKVPAAADVAPAPSASSTRFDATGSPAPSGPPTHLR